jgi:hypothetical protein
MPHKIKELSLLILILLLFFNRVVYPYDNRYVHQNINKNAALQSTQLFLALKNQGFTGIEAKDIFENNIVYGQKIKFWFHEGARLEDETDCRSKFHFHDPTKSWDAAGLSNVTIDTFCLDYTHRSSLVWAQDTGNLWTWQKAKQYYHDALTNTDRNMREQKLAYTFRSLGQVMHLISDSSVPAHARNDIHIFPYTIPGIGVEIGDPTFESWAIQNYKNLNYNSNSIIIEQSIFGQSAPNPSAPIAISALWDVDKYTGSNPAVTIENIIGLAEYSNANFFSEDTIFTDYSYPAWSSVEEYDEIIDISKGKSRTYLRKVRDGEIVNHLATGKWFYKYLPSVLKRSGLKLDEQVYQDYAEKLIPRAVGYSAGLLDYFFRGTLEITPPDEYIYSIIDGSINLQQFTKIKAKVKNTTLNEVMQAGILQTVARYKPIPNYSPDLSNYPPDGTGMHGIDFSYSVSAPISITSLSSKDPTEFTFDFSGSPIPAGITDLYLQVIFKGTIGNEKDAAIAVGMKDLKEPTHQTFWNLTDRFSLDGHLYTAEQIRADADLLSRAGDSNIDPLPMNYEISYMADSPPLSPPLKAASINNIPAGKHIRLIMLVDSGQEDNYGRLTWSDNIDSQTGSNYMAFEGVINEDIDGYWQTPTPLITFRNVKEHFYAGILRCKPVSIDPITGEHYCAYPESEEPPADTTPYTVIIDFQ